MNAGDKAQLLIDLIVEESSTYNHIGRTIIARRILALISEWLPESDRVKREPVGIVAFTDQEAAAFGRETIPFGKHQGQRWDDVPMEYLIWLADESRKTWRNLHRYLNSPRILGEMNDGL